MSTLELDAAIATLDQWIVRNGWAGWDPYDCKGMALYRRITERRRTRGQRLLGRVLFEVDNRLPGLSHRLWRAPRQVNAKGMVLFGLAYLMLHRLTGETHWLQRHEACVQWLLLNNHAAGGEGLAWGYPFDWQSQILIPRETPLVVITSLGGQLFLDRWGLWGRESDREAALRCRQWLLTNLHRTVTPEGVCFAYTPLDRFCILGANLYAGAFLTRLGVELGDAEGLALGRGARRFVLAEQEEGGAWDYWSRHQQPARPRLVDNYHTGCVLEWLAQGWRIDPLGGDEEERLARGAAFYQGRLFTPEGAPRITDQRTYPIDIHSIGQALVTFNRLGGLADRGLAGRVCHYAVTRMRRGDGAYYYRRWGWGWKATIPYLRWGQAWMLWGLAHHLESLGGDSSAVTIQSP